MKFILKRLFGQLCVILIICIVAAGGYVKTSIMTSTSSAIMSDTIILDPGHGGFDGGAVAHDGTVEKDINLEISLKLCDMLKLFGFNVIMTRNEDIATDSTDSDKISARKKSDMVNRLNLMSENPQAIYVSVHLNKFTTSAASGAQVFYSPKFDEAKLLGQTIQSQIKTLLQPQNERVIKQGTSSTYLLHNAKIPAVIVECGFLSNHAELEKLKTEEYQSQIAFAICSGIIEYYSCS